jgi:hypothetical protein
MSHLEQRLVLADRLHPRTVHDVLGTESAAVNKYYDCYQGAGSAFTAMQWPPLSDSAIRLPWRPITGGTPAPEPAGASRKSAGMGLEVPRVRHRDQRKRARNAPVALAVTLRGP